MPQSDRTRPSRARFRPVDPLLGHASIEGASAFVNRFLATEWVTFTQTDPRRQLMPTFRIGSPQAQYFYDPHFANHVFRCLLRLLRLVVCLVNDTCPMSRIASGYSFEEYFNSDRANMVGGLPDYLPNPNLDREVHNPLLGNHAWDEAIARYAAVQKLSMQLIQFLSDAWDMYGYLDDELDHTGRMWDFDRLFAPAADLGRINAATTNGSTINLSRSTWDALHGRTDRPIRDCVQPNMFYNVHGERPMTPVPAYIDDVDEGNHEELPVTPPPLYRDLLDNGESSSEASASSPYPSPVSSVDLGPAAVDSSSTDSPPIATVDPVLLQVREASPNPSTTNEEQPGEFGAVANANYHRARVADEDIANNIPGLLTPKEEIYYDIGYEDGREEIMEQIQKVIYDSLAHFPVPPLAVPVDPRHRSGSATPREATSAQNVEEFDHAIDEDDEEVDQLTGDDVGSLALIPHPIYGPGAANALVPYRRN
jgi:hypothetical protein